jgi:hypothetical protein
MTDLPRLACGQVNDDSRGGSPINKKGRSMTTEHIDTTVKEWLAVNQKTPAQVRHDIYPIGFVAALLEQLEKSKQARMLPTAKTFAYFHESVMTDEDEERQKELKKMTDWWLIWRSDWNDPKILHGAAGRDQLSMPKL